MYRVLYVFVSYHIVFCILYCHTLDKLIFIGKKATHNGAGNHLQITHEDFFGAHASQERNVYMRVEEHVPKTTPAQRRAIIEHVMRI